MPLTGAHPCWLYTDTHTRTHTSYPSSIRRRERAQVVAQDKSSATIWHDFFSLPPLYLAFTHTHALPHISFDLDPLRGYTRRGKKKNEAGLSLPALTPPPPAPPPAKKEGNLKIIGDKRQLRCQSKIKITHRSQGPKFFFSNLYESPPPLSLLSLSPPSSPPFLLSLHLCILLL